MARTKSLRTIQRDGVYWFASRYAATLLSTTPRKIEMLIAAGLLEMREYDGAPWVAEMAIMALRRHPAAWAATRRKVCEHGAAVRRARTTRYSEYHARGPDQAVLPIADYRHKMPGRKD